MVDVSPDGKISLSLFEGSSYIVVVETNPWGDKVECGMAKVDISSQPFELKRAIRISAVEFRTASIESFLLSRHEPANAGKEPRLPTGPLRPDDETAWKAVAKNYDVTNTITNLENGYLGIMGQVSVRILRVAHPHHSRTTNLLTGSFWFLTRSVS